MPCWFVARFRGACAEILVYEIHRHHETMTIWWRSGTRITKPSSAVAAAKTTRAHRNCGGMWLCIFRHSERVSNTIVRQQQPSYQCTQGQCNAQDDASSGLVHGCMSSTYGYIWWTSARLLKPDGLRILSWGKCVMLVRAHVCTYKMLPEIAVFAVYKLWSCVVIVCLFKL